MTRLEGQRDDFIAQIEQLNDDLQRELNMAHELADMRGFFGDFAGSIKKQQQQLAAKVIKTEQQIQELAIKIQQQFAEVKKYEIAYDNYLAELARQEKHREQLEMDEIGIRNALYGES